ncbi:MAG: ATP-binding protein [Candidatus Micrarchaeota archaeon]
MDFVKEALLQNGHWEAGQFSIKRIGGRLIEREAFPALQRSARKKYITVLRGLRRTGKSVLAQQLLIRFLGEAGEPKEIAWFEFDRAMNATPEDLDSLLNYFQGQGAKIIFLDEVPFVPKWQDVLKRHYDRTDVKFVATGSSAIEFDKRTAESLAGRFEIINVTPFSLNERLLAKGKKAYAGSGHERARRAGELQAECNEYLLAGGLPEITLEADENERSKYVRESLLGPLFYKDFPAAFPSANPDLLFKSLELLSGTAGSTYQLQPLAQVLGVSHPTVATQVALLEKTLLLRTIYNHTPSIIKQRRTSKKIVFADTGVLHALRPDVPIGALAENAAANALDAKFFWRTPEGHEVDLLLPGKKVAIEVKYQAHLTSADERNLQFFLEHRKGWKGVMITKMDSEKGDIPRIPLWKVLLGSHEAIAALLT